MFSVLRTYNPVLSVLKPRRARGSSSRGRGGVDLFLFKKRSY